MKRRIFSGAALVMLLAFVLTVAAIPGVWRSMTDSVRVNSLAHQIADFELPEGYQPDYAVEVLGYAIAAYKGSDEHSHLVLLRAPQGMALDENMLAGYVANNQGDAGWLKATVIKTEQRTVRAGAAAITVSERTNSEGQRYRQLNLFFNGNQGPALLVINQLTSRWNSTAIESFIASIH